MIDKILITQKLENFFKNTNPESFLKIFVISLLFDKTNYIETIVGYESTINMLDKYIYNLEKNIKSFKRLEKYHSIYAKYEFKEKCLKYYMTADYTKLRSFSLNSNNKKEILIKEFKIMMYKEFEKIINIYTQNGRIISNGFYIEDHYGHYPEYDGDFSNIMDIFSEAEVCDILGINDTIITYIDENRKYFVYSKHISQRNSEVINYVELWKKFFDNKLYYFAVNNPKKYSEKMIVDFNNEYKDYFANKYNLALGQYDLYSLFTELSYNILNQKGIYGFILPKRLATNENFQSLRDFYINKFNIIKILLYICKEKKKAKLLKNSDAKP